MTVVILRRSTRMLNSFMTDSGSFVAWLTTVVAGYFLSDSSLCYTVCLSANEQLGGHVHK